MRNNHQFWHKHKKQLVAGGIVIAVICTLGGLVVWNILSYHAYERQYLGWHNDLRTKTDQALKLPAADLGTKEKKRSNLIALNQLVSKGRSICDSYPLLHWEVFIPAVKQKIESCNQKVAQTDQFGDDLRVVVEYLASEQAATNLVTTRVTNKLGEAEWKQQPQSWDETIKQLDTLRPSKSFQPVQQLIKDKALLIQKAWQSLVAASEANDRAKYDEAIGQLTTAYGALGDVSDLSEKTILPLVTTLEISYNRAFH